jgi:hypothetical protein
MERTERDYYILDMAKPLWPIDDETKIVYTTADRVEVQLENDIFVYVRLDSLLQSYKAGYMKETNTLYIKEGGGGWVNEPESGYQRWRK